MGIRIFYFLLTHLFYSTTVATGGNFFQGYGGGELYDGKYIANDTSTILVSINYRLGILGYMASEKIEGNFGLQDQIQALNWVQKNIGAFGGDPERVTLFGQSAGSMSTAALLNCPAAEGLFSKAIMESEPFALPFRTLETYKPVARDWFKFLGCAYNDVECVRNIDSDTIIKSQTYLMQDLLANLEQPLALFTPFTPLLDTKLVPMPPMDALKNGVSRSMPVMLGNTAQEGNLFVFEALPKPTPTIEYWALADLIFSPKLGTKITTKYAVPSGETDARVTMSNATTDGIFICPNRNATRGWANAQAGRENVWYYIFDHPPSDGSAWGNQTYCAHVSCHGEDLPFVFHFIDPSVFNFTAAEVQLSWTMVDYWTNFAHTGNPNGVTGLNRRQITTAAKSAFPNVAISESHLAHWPAYVTETSLSMHFSTPNVYIDTRYKGDTCDWWDAEIGYVFP